MILFDEIEKAHPEVWNALLQILDDGRLTDGQGRVVDFRNTVLIMTSNLGTEFVRKGGSLGFLQKNDEDIKESHTKIEKALKDAFRPEFLNRIDEVIMFSPLTIVQMRQIVGLANEGSSRSFIRTRTEGAAKRQGYGMAGVSGLRCELRGASIAAGSAKTRRKPPLSVKLLSGEYADGDTVVVDVDVDEKIVFQKLDQPRKEKAPRVEEKAQS